MKHKKIICKYINTNKKLNYMTLINILLKKTKTKKMKYRVKNQNKRKTKK